MLQNNTCMLPSLKHFALSYVGKIPGDQGFVFAMFPSLGHIYMGHIDDSFLVGYDLHLTFW